MVRRLGELTSPEVGSGSLLVVPLGSLEQHGPHLPLDTDTRVAVALADTLASRREDVVVAPPVAFGSSGEHAGFAGTISIGQDALELLIVEMVRSLGPELRGTVFVCAHGGNAEPLLRATSRLRGEGRAVLAWMAATRGDLHAGRTETSLMLAIAPHLVHTDRAVAGDTRPFAAISKVLRTGGIRAVSPNGVLGDPTGASAEEGQTLLAELGVRVERAVAGWDVSIPGPTS